MPETLLFPWSKGSEYRLTQWSADTVSGKDAQAFQMLTRKGGPTVLGRNPTTSLFSATTITCAIGAGITATVGTRLALLLIDVKTFIRILFIPITRHGCPVLWFLVTSSQCQDWLICARAPFLRSGSRFSGPPLQNRTPVLCDPSLPW